MVRIVAASVWTVAAATTVPAAAQPTLTVGRAALLSGSRGEANLKMLRDGFTDSEPGVRAVTARIAGLLGRVEMAGDIDRALENELDPIAAGEQARALLYLQGADAQLRLMQVATRQPVVRSIVAEWLARTRPREFAAALQPLLRSAPAPEALTIGRIAVMAILQTPPERERIVAALSGAESAVAWRAFLEDSRLRLDSPASLLRVGVASSNAAVREATIWFGVLGLATGALSTPDVKTALAAPLGGPRADETEWAVFGRHLAARRLEKARPVDGSQTIERHAVNNRDDAHALGLVRELTNAERAALRTLLADVPGPAKYSDSVTPQARPIDTKGGALPMRTVTSLTRGFLFSLLAATKCTPPTKAGAFGAARISYHPDGRPATTDYDLTTIGPDCAVFVRALAALEVPPPDQPVIEGVPQWLYVPMNKDWLDCADKVGQSDRADAVTAGTKPEKIHDRKPGYPEAMQQARVQGVVVIEALISPGGCVASAKIRRSVAIPLDLAALDAVLDWRFSPLSLSGNPGPVIVILTVNFTLV